MVIGVTGNSGTGKTYISKILANKINAKLVDADKIVREMYSPDNSYYKEIVKKFGIGFLKEDKTLDRKKLAELIFSDYNKRKKLNRLTNKYVVPEIVQQITDNTVIDVPLLFESKLDKKCDITIAVLANEEVKLNRIVKRDNITVEAAKARLKVQAKDKYYMKKADFIIFNDVQNVEDQINNILSKIKG